MDIMKQPNGKYALFKRQDLDFEYINLEPAQILEHHICGFLWQGTDTSGFTREMHIAEQMGVQFWNACLLMIKIVHGRRRYREILTQLGEDT